MEQKEVEKLLKKAQKPQEDALKLHPYYEGKVEMVSKVPVRNSKDFAIWYTPGVAAPCKAIKENKELVYEHTSKGNTIAVISDGTRILGLGDIGPWAGLPVMEGKALIFKHLGGVDAVPICLNEKDPARFIDIVKALEPAFGGINLEDIAKPKCFYILERLRKEMDIPVWHDDQQGTAAVTVAGMINAAKITGRDFKKLKIVMLGTGAAGLATLRLLVLAGVDPGNIILVDRHGIVYKDREDLKEKFPYNYDLVIKTNREDRRGGMDEAFEGMDAFIGYSKPGPGVVSKKHIQSMAKDPIAFPCANPVPEIWPWEAKEAGAKVVATGRSDFPNQVNNSLGFPGIFRGTLDVRARTITDEMCLAATYELAKVAEDKGLREDYIIPSMDEWEVYPREAVAVAMKAIEQGVARKVYSKDDLYRMAEEKIKRARDMTQLHMEKFIKPMPEGM